MGKNVISNHRVHISTFLRRKNVILSQGCKIEPNKSIFYRNETLIFLHELSLIIFWVYLKEKLVKFAGGNFRQFPDKKIICEWTFCNCEIRLRSIVWGRAAYSLTILFWHILYFQLVIVDVTIVLATGSSNIAGSYWKALNR